MKDAALEYSRQKRNNFLEQLKELLRIPSVSSSKEHINDIRRAAEWLQADAERIGLENIELIETEGHPIVYADWLHAAGQPTVLVYGHYDVQPPDPLDEWHTPPFEPKIRDGKIFARGSADDKGQVFAQLKAIEAYLKTKGSLPVNIKLCLEGEEEIGSRHLQSGFQTNHERFAANVCVISDSPMRSPEQPVLVYGLRGIVTGEIEVTGPSHDLHSGGFGGAVHNPLQALVEILASLHDNNGKITISHFYDEVRALSQKERDQVLKDGVDEATILRESEAPAIWGEPEYSVAERIGARPTLEIHGITGGFTGEGIKTIIPAKATAKISMRLIPRQKPKEVSQLLERHIQAIAPATVNVQTHTTFEGAGAIMDQHHPAMEAAALAFEKAFGRRPLFTLEGGSIPVVSALQEEYDIPVVLMGFGLPDDRLHSPNEKFNTQQFARGIDCAIHFLAELRQN